MILVFAWNISVTSPPDLSEFFIGKFLLQSNLMEQLFTAYFKLTDNGGSFLFALVQSTLKIGVCCILEAKAGCKNNFMLKLKHIYTAVHQNKTRRFPLLLRLLKSLQINIQILLTPAKESGQPEVKLGHFYNVSAITCP